LSLFERKEKDQRILQYFLDAFTRQDNMSISKLSASWLSGHNENTLALANLNFDFALFKVEAPTEYQELGKALSPTRRKIAEDGDLHRE
jgi:hypothetical protein